MTMSKGAIESLELSTLRWLWEHEGPVDQPAADLPATDLRVLCCEAQMALCYCRVSASRQNLFPVI